MYSPVINILIILACVCGSLCIGFYIIGKITKEEKYYIGISIKCLEILIIVISFFLFAVFMHNITL